MALKGQPYLPLFVDDFLSDEKLSLCSAESTGVYIRLMCLMHKSDEYGVILLKQKFKQSVKQEENFACMLARQMPYEFAVILNSISELIELEVVVLEDDRLIQRRMVKDEKVSCSRALAGSKGGKTTQKNKDDFALAKSEAKHVIGNVINKGVQGEKKFDVESRAYRCAVYLDEQIRERLPERPKATEDTLQKWADAFDKVNRIDKYDWKLIGRVLEFSQESEFWQKNILSGAKFRKQFETLYAQMGGTNA